MQHVDKQYVKNASSDFYVKDKEDEQPTIYKMINTIDDILTIAKEDHEETNINLIHRDDDLLKLLFDLKHIGYEPHIHYETGRVTKLMLEFGDTTYIIKTQQLCTQTIERPIQVTSETVYNNMSAAMTQMYKQMFKQSYKSYYTKQDIDILDEYRTVVNCGSMLPIKQSEALVEIDITKAFTSDLTDISRILIFNEFDNFKPYSGEEVKPNNLYIVKVNTLTLCFSTKLIIYVMANSYYKMQICSEISKSWHRNNHHRLQQLITSLWLMNYITLK